MRTRTLATKDPNYISLVPHNNETTVPNVNSIVWTTHPFENDRQSKANDHIQEQKPVSAKNGKENMVYNQYYIR